MKKIRLAGEFKTNRLRGGLLILAALALSANSLFAGVTSISQLDNACAFSFACFSDARGEIDQNAGRALGWIKANHDFAFDNGDTFDGDTTVNNNWLKKWRDDSYWKNNHYPTFGNHCSRINGGSQVHWGRPYYTLTNLNTSGWEFRQPGTEKIKGYASYPSNGVAYYNDRKIDYYVKRTFGSFKAHLIVVYKNDRAPFFYKSANFMMDKLTALNVNRTKHDLIVLASHEEKWLTRACEAKSSANHFDGPLSKTKVKQAFEMSDIVLFSSDHQFRREYKVDTWGLSNPAIYVDSGQVYNTESKDGYVECHVFDDTNPFVTIQYINADITTRKLHTGRANGGAISIKSGHDANSQYPMRKKIGGSITQPLNWSTLTVTGAPPQQASCHIDVPTGSVTKNVGDTLLVKVSASDPDGIDRVKVYMNGVEGPSDSSSPYEFNLALPTAGTFTLTAKVKDVKGNYTASDNSRTITVTSGSTIRTFTSVAAHDGYVDETSETSNVGGSKSSTLTSGTALRVGDTGARKQRRSFVSFNTASLPDNAVVTKAVLKLKRGGIVGNPSVLGNITVDIKKTSFGFGTTEALESIDFEAAASKSNVGTLSYPTSNGAWATATLNADGTSRINLTDHTQFRIRFVTDDDNDSADDYLGFYPGDNSTAANRPVLEVTYH